MLKMLQKCYDDSPLSKRLYLHFECDRISMKNDSRLGRPQTMKTDENIDMDK